MNLIDYLETLQTEYFEKIHSQFECLVLENLEEEFTPNFENQGWYETLYNITADMPVELDAQAEYLENAAMQVAERLDDEYRLKLEENE